jgi:hypothetical protein
MLGALSQQISLPKTPDLAMSKLVGSSMRRMVKDPNPTNRATTSETPVIPPICIYTKKII